MQKRSILLDPGGAWFLVRYKVSCSSGQHLDKGRMGYSKISIPEEHKWEQNCAYQYTILGCSFTCMSTKIASHTNFDYKPKMRAGICLHKWCAFCLKHLNLKSLQTLKCKKWKKKKKKFAEKVVGRCGGLPLSILRLGHLLLRTERVNCEALSRVLEHMDHNQTPWLETLEFNETDLPLDSLFTLSWPNYWKRPHLASCIFTHKAKIYHLVGLCLLC